MKNKKLPLILTSAAIAAIAVPGVILAGSWLALSNYSTSAGSSFNVMGYGFMPNESVSVGAFGSTTSATANGSGSFSTSLMVPNEPTGSYSVSASGSSGSNSSTGIYVAGYYPKAMPSSWYLLPTQTFTISGSGFMPNEQIAISGPNGTMTMTMTADGSGTFTSSSMTVPFSWENSSQTFTARGMTSGASVSMQIGFGTFYPQINPSSYYVAHGQGMSVSGSGFAPNEVVQLSANGSTMNVSADGSGSFSASVTAPSSGGSFSIMATGMSSGQSSSRTVGLMNY